jgi:hypothetical protein
VRAKTCDYVCYEPNDWMKRCLGWRSAVDANASDVVRHRRDCFSTSPQKATSLRFEGHRIFEIVAGSAN